MADDYIIDTCKIQLSRQMLNSSCDIFGKQNSQYFHSRYIVVNEQKTLYNDVNLCFTSINHS